MRLEILNVGRSVPVSGVVSFKELISVWSLLPIALPYGVLLHLCSLVSPSLLALLPLSQVPHQSDPTLSSSMIKNECRRSYHV